MRFDSSRRSDVRFVTGGVSIDTLPPAHLPEVAFVGRSNVGKSSLVNMVLGRRAIATRTRAPLGRQPKPSSLGRRRAIARTSRTPGKTQQYNYYALNEARAQGAFHLVDMPGLGFARAPSSLRREWKQFMARYLLERQPLRLLVHLIDSQVGPQDTDTALMRLVADAIAAGGQWQYAIVLTKMDKRGGKLRPEVRERVERALRESGAPADAPQLATSAKSRLGRDAVWRLLKCVALPDSDTTDPGAVR